MTSLAGEAAYRRALDLQPGDADVHLQLGHILESSRQAGLGQAGSPLFTGLPIHLTAERFNAHALADSLPLVIDFWASWCGPCQTMAPMFEALAAEFEPMVRFAKVNTDAEKELAQYFCIQSIPTLSLSATGAKSRALRACFIRAICAGGFMALSLSPRASDAAR